MKVLKDVFSGDELCSDTFPMREEGCVYVIEGKMVTAESGGDYGIAANADEDAAEGAVADTLDGAAHAQVINFVDSHRLQETQYTKKLYMAYIKAYMQRVKAHLESTNPARVAPFMAEAQAFVKMVIGKFDDFRFFTGVSMDTDAMCPLVFYKVWTVYLSSSPSFFFLSP
jgi:hypothetical protein